MAQLHDIWEIWIRDKISTKSKTANNWSISTLQQMRPKQYCFQTNLIEPCHLGKISLYFDIPSTTKFVNFFFFFENLATNIKEPTISDKAFWETSSFIKKRSNRTFQNLETPIQLLIFERTRSSILSNLQHDYSIPVTRPDNGWEALILSKADYDSKVNAILSDTYKFSLLHNDTNQHS